MALILTARTEPFAKSEIVSILANDYFHFFRWKTQNKTQADFRAKALNQIKKGRHVTNMMNCVRSNDDLIKNMDTKGSHLASYLAPENENMEFAESPEGAAIIAAIENTKFPASLGSAIRKLNDLIKGALK